MADPEAYLKFLAHLDQVPSPNVALRQTRQMVAPWEQKMISSLEPPTPNIYFPHCVPCGVQDSWLKRRAMKNQVTGAWRRYAFAVYIITNNPDTSLPTITHHDK
ncbi:hypothetical protein PCC21_008730 [Pectobacterium carotovorum subsp. carotovorum PCC21]|nr:hypothetical protein PCC21_008730 [Pectobacterium carotovorum subsp. carotovorum PCC21]